MPYLDVNDTTLYYEDLGEPTRPSLLFLHGWGTCGRVWDGQVDEFVRDHRVVTVDWRGCGRSARPAEGNSLDGVVADLVALVGALGLERPVVVGSSIGGSFAVELAARHPELISGVVCVDAPADWPARGMGLPELLDELRRDRPGALAAWVPKWFAPGSASELAEVTVRRILDSGTGIDAHFTEAQAYDPLPRLTELSALSVPVQYVHGALDTQIPLHVARECAGLCPHAEVFVVDGAGHVPHQERPAEFNTSLRAALARIKHYIGGTERAEPSATRHTVHLRISGGPAAVAYDRTGTGPGLVLVHGTAATREQWLPLTEAVADRFTVVAPDLSGSGGTVDHGGPVTPADLADEVLAAADDAGLGTFHLVGHSLGAAVAAQLAGTHPHRVRSLALHAAWAYTDVRMTAEFRYWLELLRADAERGTGLFARMVPLMALGPNYWDSVDVAAYEELVGVLDETVALEGAARQTEADLAVDLRPLLGRISAPTLVLASAHDRLIGAEQQRALLAGIPGARYAELDMGHGAPGEDPAAFAARLVAFLDEQQYGTGTGHEQRAA